MKLDTMHLVSNRKVSVIIRDNDDETWKIQVIKKYDSYKREVLPAFVVSNIQLIGNPNAAEARHYAEMWMMAAVIAEVLDARFQTADDLRQRVNVELDSGNVVISEAQ